MRFTIPSARAVRLLLLALAALPGCASSPPTTTGSPSPRSDPFVTGWTSAETEDSLLTQEQVAPASPSGPPALRSLEDVRSWALAHNRGLRARQGEWRASQERAPQARALPDPVVTWAEYLEEVETRVGPQERRLGVSQSFPWFGKLSLRGDVEEATARGAFFRYLAAVVALDHELRTNWAEFYYLGKSIEVTREILELLERLEGVARQRLATGAAPHSRLVRLQVEIGRLEDAEKSLLDRERPLRARILAALDLPPTTPLDRPSNLPDLPPIEDEASLLALVRAHNPDLATLASEVEKAELTLELADKESYPDFTLALDTIVTGKALSSSVRGSGDDAWILTLGVKLPLWQGRVKAGKREARHRLLSARERRIDRENALLAELVQVLYDARDAERRTTLYRDTLLPKAEESLLATETAFRAGQADFLDLIDAERVLLEFRLATERARADRSRAQASLDRLLGRSLMKADEEES